MHKPSSAVLRGHFSPVTRICERVRAQKLDVQNPNPKDDLMRVSYIVLAVSRSSFNNRHLRIMFLLGCPWDDGTHMMLQSLAQ